MDLVLLEQRDGVALVTMNRPDKRNALSIALRRALTEVFTSLTDDDGVRAVILTGAPPAFCGGMDHTEFGGDEPHKRELFDSTRALFDAIRDVPVPLLAAINGPAIGGGFVLAAACDLLIAARTAVLQHVGLKMGIPVSYGALLRVASPQIARELAFTARAVEADEALALGLVRAVADDAVAHARELAAEIAAYPRDVLVKTKRLVRAAEEGGDAQRATNAELRAFHRGLFGVDP